MQEIQKLRSKLDFPIADCLARSINHIKHFEGNSDHIKQNPARIRKPVENI